MSDLDFSKPAEPDRKPAAAGASQEANLYDPKLALKFFQLTGELEVFPAGEVIFKEQDKSGKFFSKGARIYLLVEGQVALTMREKPLSLVMPGEIFGEVAVISDTPRTATATARKATRVISLDEKRFLGTLQQMPDFALMLLSVMSQRLRRAVERWVFAKKERPAAAAHTAGLDKKMLAELRHEMGDPTPKPARAGETIVNKGAAGVSMFVVTEGQVTISVDGLVVEHVGPGGTFGEMALLGGATRAATATAQVDSAWLSVGREDFLTMVKAKPAFGIALLRSMSERIKHVGTLPGD